MILYSIDYQFSAKKVPEEVTLSVQNSVDSKSDRCTDLILKKALNFTGESLRFKLHGNEQDPAKTLIYGTANCIGYAALCTVWLNEYFRQAGMDDYEAIHVRGEQTLLGYRWQSSIAGLPQALKDHDYVIIKNKSTGEIRAIDPALFDYTGTVLVNVEEPN